jgi:hypothetical protein
MNHTACTRADGNPEDAFSAPALELPSIRDRAQLKNAEVGPIEPKPEPGELIKRTAFARSIPVYVVAIFELVYRLLHRRYRRSCAWLAQRWNFADNDGP